MTQAKLLPCEDNSPEWHANRKQGVGGSDCAAALGQSRWKSPYQLYCEKRGELEPVKQNWDMRRGKIMEPLLRQHYADTTGRTVKIIKGILVHPEFDFIRYSPDGLSDDRRLQEFKTARSGKEWGDAGTDNIPQEYVLQVQHGLLVTGYEVADISVSIGGGEPQYFEVEADRELQGMIIDGLHEFWRRVKEGDAPEATTAEDVARRHPKANPEGIFATPDIIQVIDHLKNIRNELERYEADEEDLKTKIKLFMGDHDTLLGSVGNVLCTWKNRKGAAKINSKKLREDYPDIAEIYTEISPDGRTFLVK